MYDLISRQAAIDAVKRLHDVAWENWEETKISANTMIDALKDLPSVQPERLTDDDFETIRIHLSAHKEKLCNQRRWKEAEEYQRIIDRFMAFASAQPDLQPTCNQLATDSISRQAAINAIDEQITARLSWITDVRLERQGLDVARIVIEDLPSVQSERKKGKWIRENIVLTSNPPQYRWHCSECGKICHWFTAEVLTNFCPNCGADMRGDKNEND